MAWFAIVIVVLASSGNNIGKVLQKQATRTLPKLTLRQDIIVQYLRSGLWLTGTLTDLGGALLMIVAFAYAPVGSAAADCLFITVREVRLVQGSPCDARHCVPHRLASSSP